MSYFDVTIKTRLRAEELQQVMDVVKDPMNDVTSRSDFIRVAIMKLLREYQSVKADVAIAKKREV